MYFLIKKYYILNTYNSNLLPLKIRENKIHIFHIGENFQEKNTPVQLTPALVRSPSSRRGLNGTKPVPPIPRGISLLPDKADFGTVGHKKKQPDDIWKSEKDCLTIDLSELNFRDKDLDQEEVRTHIIFNH